MRPDRSERRRGISAGAQVIELTANGKSFEDPWKLLKQDASGWASRSTKDLEDKLEEQVKVLGSAMKDITREAARGRRERARRWMQGLLELLRGDAPAVQVSPRHWSSQPVE